VRAMRTGPGNGSGIGRVTPRLGGPQFEGFPSPLEARPVRESKQGRTPEGSVPVDREWRIDGRRTHQAPYLSNMRPLACIRRMRYLASKMPNDPELAPVSVKRASLSLPLISEWMSTGCGCHE